MKQQPAGNSGSPVSLPNGGSPSGSPNSSVNHPPSHHHHPALTEYKRVAVVENFFDIIYNVHVEMDGRSGKHAGQKRTYRAVCPFLLLLTLTFFFILPRVLGSPPPPPPSPLPI